jgi:hypothetical protein
VSNLGSELASPVGVKTEPEIRSSIEHLTEVWGNTETGLFSDNLGGCANNAMQMDTLADATAPPNSFSDENTTAEYSKNLDFDHDNMEAEIDLNQVEYVQGDVKVEKFEPCDDITESDSAYLAEADTSEEFGVKTENYDSNFQEFCIKTENIDDTEDNFCDIFKSSPLTIE